MSTTLRASVTADATGLAPGADVPIIVDGADSPITANGLQGYVPTPGDRLLVTQVGTTMEVIQFVSTGTVPNQSTYRQATAPDPATTPNHSIWYDSSNGNLASRLEGGVWVPMTLATGSFDNVDVRRTIVERGYTMSSGGTAVLSSGIVAPTTAPTIDAYYPSYATDAARGTFQIPQGLTNHATDASLMAHASIFFGTAIRFIQKSDFTYHNQFLDGTWSSQYYAFNGLCQLGADYYLLGQDNNRGVAQYLYRIDGTTGAKTSELAIAGTGITYTKKPALVSNGSQVGVVWWNGSLWLRWYDPTTWLQVGSDIRLINSAVWGFGELDIGDVVWGDAGSGLGASTLWLAFATNASVLTTEVWTSVTTTGFAAAATDFPTAPPASGSGTNLVNGMHYDSAQGRMLHYDNSVMYVYSKLAASGSQSVTARYTYYDGDTGNYAGSVGSGTVFVNGVDVSGTASTAHETGYSPTATTSIPRRSWVRITALQAPDVLNLDTSLVDRANRHGIYVAIGGGTMFRQVYTAVGTRLVDAFDTMPSTGTPDTHDFTTAQASLGAFRSSQTRLDGNPKTYMDGSGIANIDGLIPPGSTMMWLTGTIPAGWILLDGTAVSRSTYADLFAKWGTTFGAGNGTTTFNLPDMRSRIPLGAGTHAAVGNNEGDPTESDRAGRFDHRHNHGANTGAGGTGATSTDATVEAGHTHSFIIGVATNTTASGASTRVTTVAGQSTNGGTATTGAGSSHAHSHSHTGPNHTHSIATDAMAAGAIADHPFLAVNFIAKI
jgi:microcystin-dependent protein